MVGSVFEFLWGPATLQTQLTGYPQETQALNLDPLWAEMGSVLYMGYIYEPPTFTKRRGKVWIIFLTFPLLPVISQDYRNSLSFLAWSSPDYSQGKC